METLTTTTKVSDEGTLTLRVPATFKGATVQADYTIKKHETGEPVDENGWPVGFFEKYVGCITDPKFTRPPQGVMEPIPPFE